jgi:hypothetical protein
VWLSGMALLAAAAAAAHWQVGMQRTAHTCAHTSMYCELLHTTAQSQPATSYIMHSGAMMHTQRQACSPGPHLQRVLCGEAHACTALLVRLAEGQACQQLRVHLAAQAAVHQVHRHLAAVAQVHLVVAQLGPLQQDGGMCVGG